MNSIKQISLFGIAFISTMVMSELFIRTSNLTTVSQYEFYNDIGRGFRRNLNFVYFNEGFGIGKYNEYRYIGEPNPPKKNENTIRIILMGDSYVESHQIFERDYFGNIAENRLTMKYKKKRFEFLNFGRSDSDIADIYAYQKTFAENFNPDYILYMLSEDDLEPIYADPLRPKTILVNDTLDISFNFVSSKIKIYKNMKFAIQNSCILEMLNKDRKKTKKIPILSVFLDKLYTWYKPADKELIPEKHSKYQLNPMTSRIVKSLNPEKIIFVNRGMQELPKEFLELCFDNGFRYIDLSIALNLMKDQGVDPIEWRVTKKSGHWNQNAHRIIGEEIAENISDFIND